MVQDGWTLYLVVYKQKGRRGERYSVDFSKGRREKGEGCSTPLFLLLLPQNIPTSS